MRRFYPQFTCYLAPIALQQWAFRIYRGKRKTQPTAVAVDVERCQINIDTAYPMEQIVNGGIAAFEQLAELHMKALIGKALLEARADIAAGR